MKFDLYHNNTKVITCESKQVSNIGKFEEFENNGNCPLNFSESMKARKNLNPLEIVEGWMNI
ncbi:hypothetical protein LDENG_00093640 [Lucifuga dentata]|nr:hypothetical protein LDENG_00093640 [Lucifuga dentata]